MGHDPYEDRREDKKELKRKREAHRSRTIQLSARLAEVEGEIKVLIEEKEKLEGELDVHVGLWPK